MTHRAPRLALTLVATGVAALALTCCGGSSNDGGAGATRTTVLAGGPTSTPGASTQPPASGGATARQIDVCATVPAATAATLSGEAITTADAETNMPAQEYGCAYGNDDDSIQVEVTVFAEDNAASTYRTLRDGTAASTKVSGLGDDAFFDHDGTLYALVGQQMVQVNGLDTADASAALAKPVVTAL
jgi:hypothetical protein